MSGLTNIIIKEIRELLTPSTIIPIIVMAFIFGSMGNMMGGIGEELEKKPAIGLINDDSGELSKIATDILNERAEIIYEGSNIEEGLEKIKEEKATALLIIPANFSESIYADNPGEIEVYWIMKGAGIMDSISSEVVDGLIHSIEEEISKELIKDGEYSDIVLKPTVKKETTIFKEKELKGLSPGAISGILSSQSTMVPIIMMMIIMMAGGTVISSMGMEKENKTLETLLTLPVKRSSIVFGKIAGSAIVGLLMAIIYMLGFRYYMGSLGMSSEINLADLGLTLDMKDYFLVGTSVFITLLAALSLCMILGTFAENYKSAQTLNLPIVLLAIVPMFLTMFKDFDTLPLLLKIVVFVIPFSHPMMAMRALMFDNYLLVLSGICYVVIFSAAMMWIIVRIFSTEKVLTAKISLKIPKFKRR
ncbi:MAG TPA: ABC transporter permease [Methanomicrobia archaeon]|nr:ABC transporter permease [Methanomicrobia archaeon]